MQSFSPFFARNSMAAIFRNPRQALMGLAGALAHRFGSLRDLAEFRGDAQGRGFGLRYCAELVLAGEVQHVFNRIPRKAAQAVGACETRGSRGHPDSLLLRKGRGALCVARRSSVLHVGPLCSIWNLRHSRKHTMEKRLRNAVDVVSGRHGGSRAGQL